jgi:ABC-2 type transport system permease protein
MEHVRMGTLDFALLKPVNSQFLVSARHFEPIQIAAILVGAGVVAAGASRIDPPAALPELLFFVLTLACGTILVYTLLIGLGTLSFWFVRMENLMVIFMGFLEAGRFPVDIYPGWLRLTLSTVVPIGIAVTVPAQTIAGKVDAPGALAMVIGAGAALAFSAWFWRRGLRAYTGASA